MLIKLTRDEYLAVREAAREAWKRHSGMIPLELDNALRTFFDHTKTPAEFDALDREREMLVLEYMASVNPYPSFAPEIAKDLGWSSAMVYLVLKRLADAGKIAPGPNPKPRLPREWSLTPVGKRVCG